uniref:Tr-type G domain-containing protein n=1 Tax=Odontella aurita TaxID=265563 RepID=A0A7S4N242_9STRA
MATRVLRTVRHPAACSTSLISNAARRRPTRRFPEIVRSGSDLRRASTQPHRPGIVRRRASSARPPFPFASYRRGELLTSRLAPISRWRSASAANGPGNGGGGEAEAPPHSRPASILDDMDLLERIPLEDVRNFCFIAHVDHGKSSLASRVLELMGNLGRDAQDTAVRAAERNAGGYDASDGAAEGGEAATASGPAVVAASPSTSSSSPPGGGGGSPKEQIELLDTLAVEKERGITVKSTAASMLYRHPSAIGPTGVLLLNMVDTPGHADFGTEVTRGLLSVSGAVLLFDAAQGVQAQTLSVHDKARSMGVKILPALTKVDLPAARPLDVALAVSDLFGFDPDGVNLTSARSRIGVAEVLDAVCENVPPPEPLDDDDGTTLRAKVVDSWFEPLRGVICLVQILSGTIKEGDRVSVVEPPSPAKSSSLSSSSDGGEKEDGKPRAAHGKEHYSVQDVGLVLPGRHRTGKLSRGQMGYVIAGLRDPRQARAGTVLVMNKDLPRVPEMHIPAVKSGAPSEKSVLYASVHPMEGEGFDELSSAVDRLALNDTGLEVHRTSGSSNSSADGGPFLGPGLRVGFQGLLHVEVFRQRLSDEFGLDALVTPPKVPYEISYLTSKGHKRAAGLPEVEIVEDLAKWPQFGVRFKVREPAVNVRIMAPVDRAGDVMELIQKKRGTGMETRPVDEHTWLFSARMPWGEVVTDFHDELKNATAGYASFDTSEADPPLQESNLTKVDIVLNGDLVDPLSFVCHRDVAQAQARGVVKKLRDVLPRQQFVIVVQAKADGRVVASERVRAFRKDVLAIGGGKTVGGGDISRKKKLLAKQKKGKMRQQSSGKVTLSQAAFNSVISRT